MTEVAIREAKAGDEEIILRFIRDLAEYEKALHEVTTNTAELRERFFGENPSVFAHIVEVDGTPVGFAVWFLNFSTWLGKHGLYIEDIYIHPDHRGSGAGKAMFAHLVDLANERGYGRVEWWCLDWNEPALNFYKRMGAEPMVDWTVHRLTGDAMASFSTGSDPKNGSDPTEQQ